MHKTWAMCFKQIWKVIRQNNSQGRRLEISGHNKARAFGGLFKICIFSMGNHTIRSPRVKSLKAALIFSILSSHLLSLWKLSIDLFRALVSSSTVLQKWLSFLLWRAQVGHVYLRFINRLKCYGEGKWLCSCFAHPKPHLRAWAPICLSFFLILVFQ